MNFKDIRRDWDRSLFKTGGLGQDMSIQNIEVWLCSWQHPCAIKEDDAVCFTYSEILRVLVP